ncbi:hypothetical protein TSOC_004987 [Tetrabaena socialis]|uniref:K Homology domain-containing protein n=1 Tax=Tetrabaena socialis TaxID=47790 RepID=A0A2J8A7E7_9CHLO|nr:hypothetical protein TSOC_004987 [Tetrabaena socialis]|eukprot:PNH08454.1 hypothetical protein TSOC_004987 [Tetrabaena socialis]
MASHGRCEAWVELNGLHPGAVIGKGGANAKRISQLSGGVQLDLEAREGAVLVRGSPAAVASAAQLLRAQIDAMRVSEQWVELGGMPAGAVIGRGGANVAWIREQSGGALLDVQARKGAVLVHGRPAAVASAVQLLRAQIEAHARLGSPAYPQPLRVDYLLTRGALGAQQQPAVAFRYRDDEAARATGRSERLYVVAPPAHGGGGGGGGSAGEDLSDLLAGMSLRQAGVRGAGSAKQPPLPPAVEDDRVRWHDARALGPAAARALLEAAHVAACSSPSFDQLKIRLNLGKQFFFNLGGLERRTEGVPLRELQGLGADPARSQSVFSNCVPGATIPRITAWLAGRGGFALVDSKEAATLHVIDRPLNVHYAVALNLEGGAASLRKVKSSATKCHFVGLLGGPSQLDLRLKLIGQRRDMQDSAAQAVADRIVERCNTLGYDAVAGPNSASHLPPGMYLDKARRKSKEVYEGAVNIGCATTQAASSSGSGGSGRTLRIKLSVNAIQEASGEHHEVTGTVSAWDEELRQLLLAGGGGGRRGGGGDSLAGAGWACGVLAALQTFAADLNDQL